MSYMLDTHTFVWAVTEPQKLSTRVRSILEETDNDIVVSAVSFWEISLKYGLQKLALAGLTPEDFPQAALDTGFRTVGLSETTAATYHQLTALHHRDPFDRMLIWQALQSKFKLITKDENVLKYTSEGLIVIW